MGRDSATRLARHPRLKNVNEYGKEPCRFFGRALLAGEGERRQRDKLVFDDFRTHCVNTVGEPFMAPVTQYVFAEMLGISEHFTAGSHEWLPYSVISTFPKLICKQQLVVLLS